MHEVSTLLKAGSLIYVESWMQYASYFTKKILMRGARVIGFLVWPQQQPNQCISQVMACSDIAVGENQEAHYFYI